MDSTCDQCKIKFDSQNFPVVSLNVNRDLVYQGTAICYQCAKEKIHKHVGGDDVAYSATFNAREEW